MTAVLINKKTVLCAAALVLGSSLSAQLYWNPGQANPYVSPGTGGNGNWSDTDVWWDGAANVSAAQDPGDYVIYEGTGTVGGGTFQPQRLEFENLTGNYSINHNLELRLSGTHAVHVKDGSFDVYLQSLGYSAGTSSNRSVRNDGTGTVTINSVLRRFGGGTTNLALQGDGNFQINGSGSMGGQLIKNGAGHLLVNGAVTSFSNGIVLNGGSMWMDNSAASMTWNGGVVRFDLDETGFTSNLITLTGGFTKGTGPDYTIDFGGFNATETGTYSLVSFASTDFTSSDFSASGITFDSGLSGTFTVDGDSVDFSVIPEPGTLTLVGVVGLALIYFRRRK
jgi:hypothetical protein